MRRGDPAAGRAGGSAGVVRLARHRAADRRAQIPQCQGRAAASAQHRRVEMERSEEQQMDHGGPAAVPDRSAHSRQARGGGEAECKNRHPLQNDDFGRDFLGPFKKVLADAGGKASVIMEQTYDLTDPTVDSQLINLSKSGADVFYNISTGKATSQSVRKVAELGWKPLQLLSAGSTGRSILDAAGFENAGGIVAIRYSKDAGPGRWEKDPDVIAFEALRAKYLPTVDPDNTIAYAGYGQAVSM